MSGKRKKTDEEKAFSANRENTTVVCKLSRVCKDPDLLAEIRRAGIVLKQVQLEAWHVANLHVLRCLENDIELPTLDQTFFNRCCQGVRATGIRETKSKVEKEIKADRQRNPARHMDESLLETLRLYRLERESINSYSSPPQLEYDSNVMLDLSGKMRVNAENMIVLHFEKRLSMYARLLLEEKTGKPVPASEVKRLVRACYRAEGGDFTEDEIELRAWLGFIPYENVIKANLEYFITKLYTILQKVEASQLKDPEKKGIRSFSLLPYSSSYAAAHIVINGSTLHGYCMRIFKATNGRNPLGIPLRASGKVLQSQEDVCKSKELFLRRGFAISQFETMAPNGTISKRQFDEMDHASKSLFASRLFANQITTNGYSASVLLTRLKSETEIVKKKKKTKYIKKNKKTEEIENEDDELDWEWRTLPTDFEPSDMIAIDPGMRSLCTAVNAITRENEKVERVVEVSTKEYRQLAGMRKVRFWYENLKKREKRYAEVIASIPSYKISSYEKYLENLKIFWKHVNFLLVFCAENSFLKWRFFQYRMKNKAVDALAKIIVPVASSQVLIGYGDWSRRDCISGHAPGPVKGFRRALKRRATVVPVDEYRTSKLCSKCSKTLERARYPVNPKDIEAVLKEAKDDEVVVKETKDKKKIVLKKTRNVLRCASSDCKANFWNRDVNAARNILALLKRKLQGLERPKAFRRGI